MIGMGYAIKGKFGFYVGWWHLRRDAIEGHTSSLGVDWEYCKKKGDRCVKIEIKETHELHR